MRAVAILFILSLLTLGQSAHAEVPTIAEAESTIETLRAQIDACQAKIDEGLKTAATVQSQLDTAGDAISDEVRANAEEFVIVANGLVERLQQCVADKRQKIANLRALIDEMDKAGKSLKGHAARIYKRLNG